MHHLTKIATCSYCGTRQTLALTARQGHELACSACGAPLHEMKWLRADGMEKSKRRSPPRPAPHGHGLPPQDRKGDAARYARKKPKKRRKGLMRDLFEEAFDVLEDIFD